MDQDLIVFLVDYIFMAVQIKYGSVGMELLNGYDTSCQVNALSWCGYLYVALCHLLPPQYYTKDISFFQPGFPIDLFYCVCFAVVFQEIMGREVAGYFVVRFLRGILRD
jgi:hypothetical protein